MDVGSGVVQQRVFVEGPYLASRGSGSKPSALNQARSAKRSTALSQLERLLNVPVTETLRRQGDAVVVEVLVSNRDGRPGLSYEKPLRSASSQRDRRHPATLALTNEAGAMRRDPDSNPPERQSPVDFPVPRLSYTSDAIPLRAS
jgi:hypothetical protein